MIDRNKQKKISRTRRHARVRAKVIGTAERPRLAVFRSAKHISCQLIDDTAGRTLAAATDVELLGGKVAQGAIPAKAGTHEKGDRKAKVSVAFAVGKAVAAKAAKAGITVVVFDRGGFAYTGRVAALADGAREGGLTF